MTYKEEKLCKLEKKIEFLKKENSYLLGFDEFLKDRTISTRYSYLLDVSGYLHFFEGTLPEEICDITPYKEFLMTTKSSRTAKKMLSSVAAFYKYLHAEKGITACPIWNLPPVKKEDQTLLNEALTNQLLRGILKNDRYLDKKTNQILPIDESVFVKREKFTLRNYAICQLFLRTGIRISELVALNVEDVPLCDATAAKALRDYLYGNLPPLDLINKYAVPGSELDPVSWCYLNKGRTSFLEHLKQDFPDAENSFVNDILRLRRYMLRQGRDQLMPKTDALFVSSKGTRMTERAIEMMVNEMARTYLPQLKGGISPHTLRMTCAKNLLDETGDVVAVSKKMSYKSTAMIEKLLLEE